MTGSYIVYGLPFLLKYPDYECLNMNTDVWYECDREKDICDAHLPLD